MAKKKPLPDHVISDEVAQRATSISFNGRVFVPWTICAVLCNCGPEGEPLACGYAPGHRGDHSWATLPTFPQPAPDLPGDEAAYECAQCGMGLKGPDDLCPRFVNNTTMDAELHRTVPVDPNRRPTSERDGER